MLSLIFLMTAAFCLTYPLALWVGFREPLRQNFQRFHIGLPCVLLGLLALGGVQVWGMGPVFYWVGLWWALSFLLCLAYWNDHYPTLTSLVCLTVCGAVAFVQLFSHIYPVTMTGWDLAAFVIGAAALSWTLFAMNLGHWYLNVPGLSLTYLQKAVRAAWILTGVRVVWDLGVLVHYQVTFYGDVISVWVFLSKYQALAVWVAILFGVLFPLIGFRLVWGTLKVKSTQSATGILYVLVASLFMGEIAARFAQWQWGLPL